MTKYDKDEAYPLGFMKSFQWHTGSLWLINVWLINSHFLSFISLRPLVSGDVNATSSLLTPRVPLNSHHCTKGWKNADVTSTLLYWINGTPTKGEVAKIWKWEENLWFHSSRGKETAKSPNILKEMVKCSQDSISQFNKNTVPYGAWNVSFCLKF